MIKPLQPTQAPVIRVIHEKDETSRYFEAIRFRFEHELKAQKLNAQNLPKPEHDASTPTG